MLRLALACAVVVVVDVASGRPTDAIGRDVGMSASQIVDVNEGARIIRDAEDGRPDNLRGLRRLALSARRPTRGVTRS